MYLCIDQGNSRIKTGIFREDGTLVKSNAYESLPADKINDLIASSNIDHVIISSTAEPSSFIKDIVASGQVLELSHTTPLPIGVIYSTPHTLGRDRIAGACGAHYLFPEKTCLVVDAGTCVTMDIKLASGIFAGGNIAPGIAMRLEAMHEKTGRLPLVGPSFPETPFGDSTEHAMQNGACLGVIMEIEGILNRAKKAYGEVLVVITGGDSGLLAAKIDYQIFVEPELVMQGLFQILSFNVKNSN